MKSPLKEFADMIDRVVEQSTSTIVIQELPELEEDRRIMYDSPIGFIEITEEDQRIFRMSFNDDDSFPPTSLTPATDLQKRVKDFLDGYFNGEQVSSSDFPVDIGHGTDFQKSVWEQIHEIPYGEVRSYKWIAEQIGRPKAIRAVGNATGSNPASIIIPCHRVIGSNGNLGGYGGGLDRKRYMLSLEGYPVETLSGK